MGVTRVLADQWVAVLGLGCLALDPTTCKPHFPHPFFSRFLIGRYPLGKWERRRFFKVQMPETSSHCTVQNFLF